jgi:predicted GIY-YIG superfamily endonuclease
MTKEEILEKLKDDTHYYGERAFSVNTFVNTQLYKYINNKNTIIIMKTEEQRLKWNAYMREYNKKSYDSDKESDRKRKKYLRDLDGYFYIYYLPEEHYIGMTNCVHKRIKNHDISGKIVNDYEILARFKRQVDAHLFETKLHAMDYNGFFVGNYNKILHDRRR